MKNAIEFLIVLYCFTVQFSIAKGLPNILPMTDSLQQNMVQSALAAGEETNLRWSAGLATQSPDANRMIHSIATPADKYTGVVNVQIPICEISSNHGSVPVTLQYMTSGIRVDDIASVAGLGWRLSAGGKISRMVRGEPDVFWQLNQTTNLSYWNDVEFGWCRDEHIDSQPDVYYFEFPGASGSFVFDGNGVAYTVPYQNIKIEFSETSDQFTLYDSAGTRYRFKTKEKTRETNSEADRDRVYTSSWFMDRIEYLDGAIVELTYETGANYSYINSNYVSCCRRHTSDPRDFWVTELKDVSTTVEIQEPKYLSSISYREQNIEFTYDTERTDISNLKRLTKITTFGRMFTFSYDVFPNNSVKLTGLQEQPLETLIKPICKFEYFEDANLPNRSYLGFDHWGYCNTNVSNPQIYPDVPEFETPNYTRASRKPVLLYTRANSLKKLIYPNGGSKEFVYELHRGMSQKAPYEEKDAGGLRIKQIIEKESDGAIPSITSYTYENGVIFDRFFNYCIQNSNNYWQISSRPVSATNDLYGSSVVYSKVTKHLPNDSYTEYDYVSMEDCPDFLPERYIIKDNWAQYDLNDWEGKSPMTSRGWGRNILKKVVAFTAYGMETMRQEFEYKMDSARMVSVCGINPYFDAAKNCYCLGRYFWISCPVLLEKSILREGFYNLPETTQFVYNDAGVPTAVVNKQCDGTIVTQKMTYPVDFSDIVPSSAKSYWMRRLINRNALIPIEQVTYKNGTVIQASGADFRPNYEYGPYEMVVRDGIVKNADYSLKKAVPIDSLAFAPIALDASYGIVFNEHYETKRFCDEYNIDGDLLCWHDKDGMYNSSIYSNTRTYPIANITNARYSSLGLYNQVYYDNFEDAGGLADTNAKSGRKVYKPSPMVPYQIESGRIKPGTYVLSFWYRENWAVWKKVRTTLTIQAGMALKYITINFRPNVVAVDDFSILPQNAVLTSSVIIPGIGLDYKMDEKGYTTYYRYNRLALPDEVLDNGHNIRVKYIYDDINM